MGKIIHKSTEIIGDIVICTNVYSSQSGDDISITQDIYDRDNLAHKNNVMLPVSDLEKILVKVSGVKYGRTT